MKEPKIIDRGTAAKLWAEGDDRVAGRSAAALVTQGWELVTNKNCWWFRSKGCEFALIDPEPEIVKPVVFGWGSCTTETVYDLTREDIGLGNGPLAITIRPQSQQAERDRLEREWLRAVSHYTHAYPETEALRDFIKKEMA